MGMIRRFMYGRYGSDQFSYFLLGVYFVVYLLSSALNSWVLYYVGYALVFFSLYRMLSRNFQKRRAENEKFLTMAAPAIQWFRLRRTAHKDKEHHYFKCPNCGQQLRVPRGKGKVQVTCRSCGVRFEKNS